MARKDEFGGTWWAKRWISALERLGWSNRLQRGRTYARQGNVLEVKVRPGRIDARVQGSRTRPYRVTVNIDPLSDSDWDVVMNVHLRGSFLMSRAAQQHMIAAGWGRIVNVASNSGKNGGRGRAAYGASKAGMINLTQTMAIELAEHGILVNAVAPGLIKTREEQGLFLLFDGVLLAFGFEKDF